MNNKLLQNEATRTYTLVFEAGDSVVDELVAFAEEHDLSASHLTAIGAFRQALLGFYNLEEKRFEEIPVDEAPPPEESLLNAFHQAVTAGVETESSGARNLITVALVEGMGMASDQGAVLSFADYMRLRTA